MLNGIIVTSLASFQVLPRVHQMGRPEKAVRTLKPRAQSEAKFKSSTGAAGLHPVLGLGLSSMVGPPATAHSPHGRLPAVALRDPPAGCAPRPGPPPDPAPVPVRYGARLPRRKMAAREWAPFPT